MTTIRNVVCAGLCLLIPFGAFTVTHAADGLNRTEVVPNNIPGTNDQNGLVKCGNGDSGARVGAEKDACDFADLITLIQNILNLTFAFAAFIAAAMFMYAGFLMITAMGDPGKITQAKAIIRRLVVGFLILFMSFLIIQQTLRYLKLSPQAQKVVEKFIDIPGTTGGGAAN